MDQEDHIVGVLDWEFSYAAPVEFTYSPPQWLPIEKPEYWPERLDDWESVYGHRLKTFLQGLINCEMPRSKEERSARDNGSLVP
jgi:hypothetical protein